MCRPTGGALAVAIALAFSSAPAAAQQRPPAACTGLEHRQFDYWVGHWNVYRTGETTLRARSRIEKLHDGCVIREEWMPLQGGGGSSLNQYDAVEQRWHQAWMDSTNARVLFEGGLVEGNMVLTGFWKNVQGVGKHGLVRMTYSRNSDGSVRQFGELSTDHGLAWAPFFDFTYRRRASPK